MTASPPKVNGHPRSPALQVLGDWQPIKATPTTSIPTDTPVEPTPADSELVAQAQAEAIRAQAWAEAEAQRIAAEADAKAALVRAEEEARKARLANDRAERKAREEQAASEARIAEHNRRRDEAERDRRQAAQEAEHVAATEQAQAAKVDAAADSWRYFAVAFAVVCGVVALPVQMAAFWTEEAPWMISAPFMLEGAAWVVLRGAAAAVAAHRPHWHFRLIAWTLAFVAAGVNLWHGLNAFDPATAIGTAVASIAGPGVWDLHEHGRISRRDGKPSRRERRAQRKAERAEAKKQAVEEQRRAAERKAAEDAASEARRRLAEERRSEFEDVWTEAVKIAAAVGSTTDDEAVWVRAYRNVKGCEPGESIESITARRAAEKRVEAALTGTPVSTLSKAKNAQRAIQTPSAAYKPVPPRRKAGDTPSYHRVAGRSHGDLLRRLKTSKSSRPKAD